MGRLGAGLWGTYHPLTALLWCGATGVLTPHLQRRKWERSRVGALARRFGVLGANSMFALGPRRPRGLFLRQQLAVGGGCFKYKPTWEQKKNRTGVASGPGLVSPPDCGVTLGSCRLSRRLSQGHSVAPWRAVGVTCRPQLGAPNQGNPLLPVSPVHEAGSGKWRGLESPEQSSRNFSTGSGRQSTSQPSCHLLTHLSTPTWR